MGILASNPEYKFITTQVADALAELPVSSKSKWGDDVWELDIHVPGRTKGNNRIKWAQKLPDGSLLTDLQHSDLLESCRRLIQIALVTPLVNSKVLDITTIPKVARSLFVLIKWMNSNGYKNFRDLDEAAIDRYVAYCRSRRGRKQKPLKPGSIHSLLIVISYLYVQRNNLPDAIQVQPFGGDPASAASGHLASQREPIPYIPDEIAVDILRKALTWVEVYADDIVAARDLHDSAYERAVIQGLSHDAARKRARRALSGFTPASSITSDLSEHQPLRDKGSINDLIDHLIAACFICIAGLVGMRISEILSLEAGFIEIEYTGDGLIELVYVRGITYKTEDSPHGESMRWVAPLPIKTVAGVLERLSATTRERSNQSALFIQGVGRETRDGEVLSCQVINDRINRFAQFVGVPSYRGAPWNFSSHQFRKTFARFVGKQDKTCLHALSQHFKHVSLAMTDYYVGSDFELHELIGEALVEDMRQSLDSILGAESLAGKMGEEILRQNYRFRGRAGEELRKDYVDFILSETDLVILSHEYALCVVQLETALCGGDMALVGRSTCVKCPNFVVGEEHRSFWTDQEERNSKLLDKLKDRPPLMQAPVIAEIKQARDILLQLDERNLEHGEVE